MRVEEAIWIGDRLRDLRPNAVLELGSSTEDFRKRRHPHIDHYIHAPLRANGARTVHADLKPDPGVDIVGDIYDPHVQAKLASVSAEVVLCCNMFEHVLDRPRLASIIDGIIPAGGHLILTVPHSCPFHLDPIDTYYRPTPEEAAALFPGYQVQASTIVKSATYAQELLAKPTRAPYMLAKRVWWLMKVWMPWERYKELNHRLFWLFRPYRMSCVLLRKVA